MTHGWQQKVYLEQESTERKKAKGEDFPLGDQATLFHNEVFTILQVVTRELGKKTNDRKKKISHLLR